MNLREISNSFSLGPFDFFYYGILLMVGFFATAFFARKEWEQKGYSRYQFGIIFWLTAFTAIFGARVWYLLFNPEDISGFMSFFAISQGRAIQGSIFFGSLSIFLYIKFFGPEIEWRYAFSILIPNILIGQAIGRWGNFFDQNVYGQIIDNPDQGLFSLLPEYIRDGMYIDGFYRQPLFLYESILNIAGWILINKVVKNFKVFKPGTHGGMYLVWYGVTRASMEKFRADEYIMQIGALSTSFIWSLIFIVVGIYFIIYYQFFYKRMQFFFQYEKKIYIVFYRSFIISLLKTRTYKKGLVYRRERDLREARKHKEEVYNSIYTWYVKGV